MAMLPWIELRVKKNNIQGRVLFTVMDFYGGFVGSFKKIKVSFPKEALCSSA